MSMLAILFAAAAAAKSGDIHVTQVNDHRAKSFARLSVTVQIPSIKSSDVTASRVILKSAVDDAGTNLMKTDAGETQLEKNLRKDFGDPGEAPAAMLVSMEMNNPPRSAKMLKELKGDIELYMPQRDPNGQATIKNFMSQSGGKNVNDRALKANGVELSILSDAQFQTMKKAALDKYRAEQKANGADGDDLEDRVKNYGTYDYLNPEPGDVLVKLNDPKKAVQSIEYVAADGKATDVRMQEKNGIVVLSTWGEKPAADAAMRVNFKTSKNVVRYPFVLTNIPLP